MRSRGIGLTFQTTNLIINLDHDEWILEEDEKKLVDVGARKSLCHTLSSQPTVCEGGRSRRDCLKNLWTEGRCYRFRSCLAVLPGRVTITLSSTPLPSFANSSTLILGFMSDHPCRVQMRASRAELILAVENETEFSFFNRAAYESFKLNPEVSRLVNPS